MIQPPVHHPLVARSCVERLRYKGADVTVRPTSGAVCREPGSTRIIYIYRMPHRSSYFLTSGPVHQSEYRVTIGTLSHCMFTLDFDFIHLTRTCTEVSLSPLSLRQHPPNRWSEYMRSYTATWEDTDYWIRFAVPP